MKKTATIFLFAISSLFLHAGGEEIERLDKETVLEMTEDIREQRVEALESRLIELNETDFKSLERHERKEMRSEFRYIKKELKAHANNGIYISTAGLIIIILLAIIIF